MQTASASASASVSVKSLKSVLTVAKRRIGKRIYGATQNIHIACNGSAVIRFTDGELRVSAAIPCEHSGADFAYQFQFAELQGMVAKTKSKELTITPAGRVSAGIVSKDLESPWDKIRIGVDSKGVAELADVCALVPHPREFADFVYVDALEFRDACKALLHCVDTEITRYALGGILLKVCQKSLELVATDSRRLGIRNIDTQGRSSDALAVSGVLPKSAVETFLALFPKDLSGETVRVSFSENSISLVTSGVTVDSPIQQGRFPAYDQILPPAMRAVSFPRVPLLEILREFAPHTSEDSRGMDFKLSPGLLRVSYGKSLVAFLEIPREDLRIKCILDPLYLIDALECCTADYVAWRIKDGELASESAMEFYDFDHREIVMPLKRDR